MTQFLSATNGRLLPRRELIGRTYPKLEQEQLDHSRIQKTLDRYFHFMPGARSMIPAAMEAFLVDGEQLQAAKTAKQGLKSDPVIGWKPCKYFIFWGLYGAPGRSRTSDLLVRSQLLYPAELRAHIAMLQLFKNTEDCGLGQLSGGGW